MLIRRLFVTRPGDEGLPGPQRRHAMLVMVLGTLMSVLDNGIVNIALPTLASELAVSESRAVWITNIYQLVCAALLLGFAALSRLVGRRRLYLGGLALFVVASLCCALSRSFEWLVASRMLQGVGAAAMLSIGPSMYRLIFPSRLLGSAIGMGALVVAFGIAFGPSLGGIILHFASWPWLFAINVPLGLLALVLGLRALPGEPAQSHGFDWTGAVLSVVMLSGFVFSLDHIGHGARGMSAWLPLLISTLCLVLFVWRQRRAAAPLVPLGMFRQARFSIAATVSLLAFVAQGIAFVGLPFMFQTVMGASPLEAALLFTPWPMALMLVGPLSGRLADRFNPTLISSLGLMIFLLGMSSLATLTADADALAIGWRAVLCGVGYGLFQAPNNREMIGSVTLAHSANASGVLASVRTFGQALGTASVGLMLALPAASLTHALWLGCVSVVAALALSVWRIPLARVRA
ncbi:MULTISPECIES: MFS transporter [Chromohalobacter]|uniref:Major facilitator superfamily MFS_1 n=1 Tax=Chromohalobacter israelensis (strain ATCC BAA-138 / DSM 3043 / CIP 106854 / NCIMB 13768 / 1H11) TaxID=290398 RepID=Q1QT68_CHRI1|nr:MULTISPECIES: MFS transporter [Chromohalobacter]ABE60340.1 major facilitator superfamily MFS_1 [Chromohalobacter salexigens DSM 3043]MBZ5876576.1 MFS transporter [Chromohalobacter salexigens]MDO0946202.1 MFS transporter [Chromohalobacter salexigens]NQY45305.1 MFS transporter [Chromohalobacter sp.]NWO56527.1 MFS transporter [Chromohalobacter salexigens]